MRRLRTHKSLVLFCIGVLVFTSLVADAAAVYTAVLTPLWIVVPAVVVVLVRRTASRCDEQPVSLLSILPSRAPPVFAHLRVEDRLA